MSIFTDHRILYVLIILSFTGVLNGISIANSWNMNNSKGGTHSAVSSAMMISFGNIGGGFAGQLYQSWDAPAYKAGTLATSGFILLALVTAVLLRIHYVRMNQKFDDFDFTGRRYQT
jgi:hypothetical protein